MSTIKFFEVRDAGTFIPAIAIRLRANNEAERYLIARAGFGVTDERQSDYILFGNIDDGGDRLRCDPYRWGDNNTMFAAHMYLVDHFDEEESGAVIDVQFISGRTVEKKESERTLGWRADA